MVDIKKRDLPAYLLLKKKIEETSGINVSLTRNGLELPSAVVKNANVVVISQCLSLEWEKIAIKLRLNGSKVVILPTEGYTAKLENRIHFATGGTIDYNSCIDRLYCWNQEMYDYSLNLGNVSERILKVSGIPRFDLYDSKYKDFRLKMNRVKKKQKISLLFISNFTQADNYYYDRLDLYKSVMKNYGYGHSNEDEYDEYLENFAFEESKSRDLCVEFIKEVSKNYDVDIVIKPHPGEKLEFWTDSFNIIEFSNVEISINDYIWGSIESADIILARSCTTQIESFLLEKCSVELVLNPNDMHAERGSVGNFMVKSIGDFDKLLTNFKNNRWRTKQLVIERKSILNNWGLKPFGNDSINNVAKDLIELSDFKANSNLSYLDKVKNYIKYYLFNSFDFFFHNLLIHKNKRRIILNNKTFIDYWGRIDKHFHYKDIDFLNSIINKIK